MNAVWLHRIFIVGNGWQEWKMRNVELLAESESCWKIRYKILGIFPRTKWINKNDYGECVEIGKTIYDNDRGYD